MNKELDEYRIPNDLYKLTTITSATKPGPGWVQVTSEIVENLENSTDNIRNAVKKLKDTMTHTGST